MAKPFIGLLLSSLLLFSCMDEKQQELQLIQAKKQEKIFADVSASWHFQSEPINSYSQNLLATWQPWRELLSEMRQKPQGNIEAFKKKTESLSKKATELPAQLPVRYAKPEVRSRIAVLISQLNSLNLFVHLNEVPADKVKVLIQEINKALVSIQMQFDEIERKAVIPKEQGESDFIKMLDTARAVPTGGVFPAATDGSQPPIQPMQTPKITPSKPNTTTNKNTNVTPKKQEQRGFNRMKKLN